MQSKRRRNFLCVYSRCLTSRRPASRLVDLLVANMYHVATQYDGTLGHIIIYSNNIFVPKVCDLPLKCANGGNKMAKILKFLRFTIILFIIISLYITIIIRNEKLVYDSFCSNHVSLRITHLLTYFLSLQTHRL